MKGEIKMNIQETFDKFENEVGEFKNIKSPKHSRPDICAFLILDALCPVNSSQKIIASATHDEIFLQVNCEELAAVATEEDILDLVRCGVLYSEIYDSLFMFV